MHYYDGIADMIAKEQLANFNNTDKNTVPIFKEGRAEHRAAEGVLAYIFCPFVLLSKLRVSF